MQFINSTYAQSLPKEGQIIQRTIVDEDRLPDRTYNPSQAKANNVVLYGLVAVVLVVIVVVAIGFVLSKRQPAQPAQTIKKK